MRRDAVDLLMCLGHETYVDHSSVPVSTVGEIVVGGAQPVARSPPMPSLFTNNAPYFYPSILLANIAFSILTPIVTGALKMLDVKMTDVKLTDQCSGHEIAGHENDGPNDRT